MMTATASLPKATRREWIGLGIIALPCLLYSMDLTVLNLAVAYLSRDLKPTSAQLLWIVDIYGFLLAGCLMTMGTLGDRIGRRKLLLWGAAAFGCASVLAAFSTSAMLLIGARALLGVAAATLAPSTLSLIRNMFLDPGERTFAIGVWVASFSAGGALGPLIGGVMLTYFWWGSVFLIAVPLMAALLVLGPLYLPEYRSADAGRLDIGSAALSLCAVLAIIFGIKRLAEHGLGFEPAIAILAGLAVACIFLRRQRGLADPLINLALFRVPAFRAALAVNILCFFIIFGSFLFIAQYLQLVLGLTPLAAGLWTMPSGLAFIVGSMLTPMVAARLRPADVMSAGFAVAASGFLVLTPVGGPPGLVPLITGFTIFSLGLAPVVTLSTDLIVGTVAPEQAGMASGLSETSIEFGGALGIAILGSIVTAIYRGAMADAAVDGLPPGARDTAMDTLGGAVTVALQLPGPGGLRLLAAARSAYTQAFGAIAIVCTVIGIVAAVVPAAFLRRRGA